MTREQKELLAFAVMSRAADLIEYWDEMVEVADLRDEGVDPEDAREQLARWMAKLPGKVWDIRLPDPTIRKR